MLQGFLNRLRQLIGVDGFGKIIVSAFADGIDCRANRPLWADKNELCVGSDGEDLFHETDGGSFVIESLQNQVEEFLLRQQQGIVFIQCE